MGFVLGAERGHKNSPRSLALMAAWRKFGAPNKNFFSKLKNKPEFSAQHQAPLYPIPGLTINLRPRLVSYLSEAVFGAMIRVLAQPAAVTDKFSAPQLLNLCCNSEAQPL